MNPQALDSKSHSSGASGEADESLFEYLHIEVVRYAMNKNGQPTKDGEENLTRLDNMGYYVGHRLIERITRELPRFKDELDMIKFICTDFWPALFQKPIDNLKTNHQGIYVLQDNEFRLLKKLDHNKSEQYLRKSLPLVAFTCGLLRGTLANLGITSIVKPEITSLPGCKFHVEVKKV